MPSILVVCTGNVCRSPMAEGFIRSSLERRFGSQAPAVSSAGTMGWEGSGATPEAVLAALERQVDIADHTARRLTDEMISTADLVVGMAQEHREVAEELVPQSAPRIFTLKELVRLLDALPPVSEGTQGGLDVRVSAADRLRRTEFEGNPLDEDVADPLGLPFDTYRAIAWELDDWCGRLITGLFGKAPAAASVFEGG